MKVHYKTWLTAIFSVALVLSTMTSFLVYGADTSPEYPLIVISGGHYYKFATHTGSAKEGNWIELSGGTPPQSPGRLKPWFTEW